MLKASKTKYVFLLGAGVAADFTSKVEVHDESCETATSDCSELGKVSVYKYLALTLQEGDQSEGRIRGITSRGERTCEKHDSGEQAILEERNHRQKMRKFLL